MGGNKGEIGSLRPRPAEPGRKEKKIMKKTLSTSEAADLLRADDNAGWSYAGARVLIAFRLIGCF